MVSKKLISEIFSHFPFFSKSVHPLIAILLWEVHNDDRNMLSKFRNMLRNMLALEISPQAEKGKPQGNIKPFSLVASPTGQEKALSGLSR